MPDGNRQFKKVSKAFETLGYQSLVSKKHKNLNTLKVTSQTVELLNNIFAGQDYKPTATEVHRQYEAFLNGYLTVVNNRTGECYLPESFKKLSVASVVKYMGNGATKLPLTPNGAATGKP